MNIYCMLVFSWPLIFYAGMKAQEVEDIAASISCETQAPVVELKKTDNIDDLNIDALIEKYEKYEYLMNHFGILRPSYSFDRGKLLKYLAIPGGIGSFWAAILFFDDKLEKEPAWFASWLVGLIVHLSLQYGGDHYTTMAQSFHTRSSLAEIIKNWKDYTHKIPEELHPMFKLLHQFYKANGKIDLEDRLLFAMMKEIAKKYKKTAVTVRCKIAEVNKQVM